MKEQGDILNNPENRRTLFRHFLLGRTGMTLRVEDDLDLKEVSMIAADTLSPLGLKPFFYDWQNLPDHLQEKLKKEVFFCMANPQYIFERNSMNIFYNCVFKEIVNDADPTKKEAYKEDFSLAYLIDFWYGGSGFLVPENERNYEDINAKVLVIITKSQYRKHLRGHTRRDFVAPVVTWERNKQE